MSFMIRMPCGVESPRSWWTSVPPLHPSSNDFLQLLLFVMYVLKQFFHLLVQGDKNERLFVTAGILFCMTTRFLRKFIFIASGHHFYEEGVTSSLRFVPSTIVLFPWGECNETLNTREYCLKSKTCTVLFKFRCIKASWFNKKHFNTQKKMLRMLPTLHCTALHCTILSHSLPLSLTQSKRLI